MKVPAIRSGSSLAWTGFIAVALVLLGGISHEASAQQDTTRWMRLFNGKDLAGWGSLAPFWKVDSGMITAKGVATFNTFCHQERTFSDFVLSVRARMYMKDGANSGIQYRSRMGNAARHAMQGYQCEIGGPPHGGGHGGVYNEGGYPATTGATAKTQACRQAGRDNDWNHFLITADGVSIKHALNGVPNAFQGYLYPPLE